MTEKQVRIIVKEELGCINVDTLLEKKKKLLLYLDENRTAFKKLDSCYWGDKIGYEISNLNVSLKYITKLIEINKKIERYYG